MGVLGTFSFLFLFRVRRASEFTFASTLCNEAKLVGVDLAHSPFGI
jgi:hypothetical protein